LQKNITLEAGLESGDFCAITESDGQSHNIYKGWPLYKFGGNKSRGDNFRVGFLHLVFGQF
jgi:predicted lipoprotein with Yx(FWY)xxD motif